MRKIFFLSLVLGFFVAGAIWRMQPKTNVKKSAPSKEYDIQPYYHDVYVIEQSGSCPEFPIPANFSQVQNIDSNSQVADFETEKAKLQEELDQNHREQEWRTCDEKAQCRENKSVPENKTVTFASFFPPYRQEQESQKLGKFFWLKVVPCSRDVASLFNSFKGSFGDNKNLLFLLPMAKEEKILFASNKNMFVPRGNRAQFFATVRLAIGLADKSKADLVTPANEIVVGDRLRVAYFLGGRTAILYRAFVAHKFEPLGLQLSILSKSLYDRGGKGFLSHLQFFDHPPDYRTFSEQDHQMKATGDELWNLVLAGHAEAATIGEVSYLKAVARGEPIVAAVELGYDSKNTPGHAMVYCGDRKLSDPKDFKGLTWGARRSSGGDELFLREYLSTLELKPSEFTVLPNLADDEFKYNIKTGKMQGAFFHFMSISGMPKNCRIIRNFDWVNSEMSEGILVFRRDWLEKNRAKAVLLAKGIIAQIAEEAALPPEKLRNKKWKNKKGMEIVKDPGPMQLPLVRPFPTLRPELLSAMQNLMVKHHFLEKPTPLDNYIDNGILEEARSGL